MRYDKNSESHIYRKNIEEILVSDHKLPVQKNFAP